MLIMAERENRLPYYIAGEFEGIAVLEAATSGLQSAEVSNMESAIEYLHRKQNGGGVLGGTSIFNERAQTAPQERSYSI